MDDEPLSSDGVLARQGRPFFASLLAGWVAARSEPGPLRELIARAREMQQENELVEDRGGRGLDGILRTVAAHTRLLDDRDWVAELLAAPRTRKGVVRNVHHDPESRERLDSI